jgi:cytochrome-b5 reductase
LTPQHARLRIPLSPSDAALFAQSSSTGNGEVTIEHVYVKNPDLQIERPYTPVNDVRGDGEVDVVVKRVQGGEVGR